MGIVIYLDSLFLLTFSINYWILKLLAYKFSLKEKSARILLAASLGAGIYILILLIPIQTRFLQMIEICLSVPLMLFVLLPKQKRALWKQVIANGFLYSFIAAGILRTVLSKWQLFSARGIHFLAVLTGAYIVLGSIGAYIRQQKVVKKHSLCQVKLTSGIKHICVKALVDTGNSLVEPISKKPVCLLEQRVLEELLQKEEVLFRAIPYSSVGCERGILYGVEIPELSITYGTEYFVARNVICAGVGHKLSTRGAYKMILHPECIAEANKEEERGEEDVISKRSKKKNIFVGRT